MSADSDPKLHHYVPRFYLRGFTDSKQQLSVYDKKQGRHFKTSPARIAAETQFYRLPDDYANPLSIETALSNLETKAAGVLGRIGSQCQQLTLGQKLDISDEDRILLAEFISAQHFRTLELRELLLFLLQDIGIVDAELNEPEARVLSMEALSGLGLIEDFAQSVYDAIWLFARNSSHAPLITSDHPVCVKDGTSRFWIKGVGPLENGRYLVFPLSPSLVMYCKERERWPAVLRHDLCVSPVELTDEMVHHENAGQAFMSSRFLISRSSDFEEVISFLPSIGTNKYSAAHAELTEEVARVALFKDWRTLKRHI